MVVLGQSGCIRAKVFVFGQKWLYSWKVAVFGQSGCIRAKVVVFVKIGCIRAKVVVVRQKWLFSGKRGCILAKVVLFGSSNKMRILGQKGKNPKNQKSLIFFNFSYSSFVIIFLKNKYILF